jgi:hypothetical protein
MKTFVAALAVFTVQAIDTQQSDTQVMNAYMEFVATHGKSFTNKLLMNSSLDKFKVNY